jgi:hypothetical protein
VQAHRPAQVVHRDRQLLDAELGEEPVQSLLEEAEVVRGVERLVRPAEAGQVERHHAVGRRDRRHQVPPQVGRSRPAVQKQDDRPGPLLAVCQPQPARCDRRERRHGHAGY